MTRVCGGVFALFVAIVFVTPALAQSSAAPSKTPTVLFMCPHGAAKSVMASALFQKMAKERGLNVRVDAAGTDPEPELSKGVVARLQKENVPLVVSKPRAATAADMNTADVVISMGCDLSRLPAPKGELKSWNVGDFSNNFDATEQAIRDQVTALVDELLAQQQKKK